MRGMGWTHSGGLRWLLAVIATLAVCVAAFTGPGGGGGGGGSDPEGEAPGWAIRV